jgi:hypothetical protein
MHVVFAISGFLGAWLLFAGPIYQSSLELREEEIDRDAFEHVQADVEQEPAPSAWWWLLPPVAYLKWRARATRNRERMMRAIPVAQREKLYSFFNKSTGWLLVGGGAFFIACKETWELVEAVEWPVWAVAPGILLPFAASIGFTIQRARRTEQALAPSEP